MKVNKITDQIEKSREYGVKTYTEFILGLPEETKEVFFLEEDDIATISESNISIYNIKNKLIRFNNNLIKQVNNFYYLPLK